MKFLTVLDVQTFLTEVGAFNKLSNNITTAYKPTDEELHSFIKHRAEYVRKTKNYRKSANQKSNWRENRTKMMKGIKAFHKSVDGKRFHRKLGRFLSSRITRKKNEAMDFTGFLENLEFLQGLNSVRQHLFTEMQYFHQAQEQIELEEIFTDYAFPLFQSIEKKIITSEELNEDEITFILDLTDEKEVVAALSEMTKKPLEEVQLRVDSITEDLNKQGIAKGNEQFYPNLVSKLSEQSWETLSESRA